MVDRVQAAWQRRVETDYIFDYWAALGWTVLTLGIFGFYVFYQLVRRMRDRGEALGLGRRLDTNSQPPGALRLRPPSHQKCQASLHACGWSLSRPHSPRPKDSGQHDEMAHFGPVEARRPSDPKRSEETVFHRIRPPTGEAGPQVFHLPSIM
jgi:hypothetical protein